MSIYPLSAVYVYFIICVPPDFVNKFIINTLYTYKNSHYLALQISKLVLPLQNSIKHQRLKKRKKKVFQEKIFTAIFGNESDNQGKAT